MSVRCCLDQVSLGTGVWGIILIILIELGNCSLWVAPFTRQEIVDCMNWASDHSFSLCLDHGWDFPHQDPAPWLPSNDERQPGTATGGSNKPFLFSLLLLECLLKQQEIKFRTETCIRSGITSVSFTGSWNCAGGIQKSVELCAGKVLKCCKQSSMARPWRVQERRKTQTGIKARLTRLQGRTKALAGSWIRTINVIFSAINSCILPIVWEFLWKINFKTTD